MPLYVCRRPRFARDVSGAGLGEYALLAALIAGVSAIAVTSLGFATRGTFIQIADATQEAGGGTGSGSGGNHGGSTGGGSGDSGSEDSGGSGDAGTPPAPGTPGDNFAITLGSQALPPANRLTPWSFDFSTLIAFQDPGSVSLSNLAWSGGSPSLPSWMSLDPSTGIASGTPDLAGEVTFEVVASYLGTDGRRVFVLDVGGAFVSVSQIAAGSNHTCVVTAQGAAMCWGSNDSGALGNGTTTNSFVPVQVLNLASGVATISVGTGHSCAVTESGAALCWGANGAGQLGINATGNRTSPTAVINMAAGVVSISAGGNHTCAVMTSGQARCWGANSVGQLGDTTTQSRFAPVQVSGLASGVVALGAGGSHSCALLTSGAVRCWGSNETGKLGVGIMGAMGSFSTSPSTAIASGVTRLSVGADHSCVVTDAGAVQCWGNNGFGRLGDGTSTNRASPVGVQGLSSGTVSVSAGRFHTCAVRTDGVAQCWGNNENGRLGDGTSTNSLAPVVVLQLGGPAASISAGGEHTCATTVAGEAKCWGGNFVGRLGNGSTAHSPTPVAVAFP